jgi:hypothetical protein
MHCVRLLALLLTALPASLLQATDTWSQFRGPTAVGSDRQNLRVPWSTTENVAWKIDVPGRGWSSPIVCGDRVFLTSVVRDGKDSETGRASTSAVNAPSRQPSGATGWSGASISGPARGFASKRRTRASSRRW